MGIPQEWGLLEYLSPFLSYQKLMVVDRKRYNVHYMDHVDGDGETIVGGPLYLHMESKWDHAQYAEALFKPPSKRFLELQPPFLKCHGGIRNMVGDYLAKSGGRVPEDSVYARYLLQDPVNIGEDHISEAKVQKKSWIRRAGKRFMHYLKSAAAWIGAKGYSLVPFKKPKAV
jgi:hypothetical protein